MTDLPPLVVFPHKRISGVDALENGQWVNRKGYPVVGAPVCPAEALLWGYDTDSHFVGYCVPGTTDPHPRLNKRSLPELIKQNIEPVLNWFIVDVDNPEHQAWTNPVSAFHQLEKELQWKLGDYGAQVGLYLTKCGYRLVTPITDPKPVSKAEKILTGYVLWLLSCGIEADESCTDWTRMFRAPFVVRDGVPQRYPARFTWLTTPNNQQTS